MDKTQSFARVIVGVMAIFFSVKVLVMMITPVGMMVSQSEVGPFWPLVLVTLISVLVLVLLQYFGVFRPEKVVSLITSHVEQAPPVAPRQWLPAAYRLVCMFAGLHCLYGVLYRGISQVSLYYYYFRQAATSQTTRDRFIRPEEIATTLVLLAMGLYLLAGAPQFVRWHLKRTARFCAEAPVA